MARPKPRDLPPENRRIWRAWQDAKQRNPDLTQGDFALTVWGTPKGIAKQRARKAGRPLSPFDQPAIHKKERQARARYLRLVFEGKRVPKQLNARADSAGGVFNVSVGHGKNTKSFNMRVPAGVSRIDAFKLIDKPQVQAMAKARAALWRLEYGAENVEDDASDIRSVRQTRRTVYPMRLRTTT